MSWFRHRPPKYPPFNPNPTPTKAPKEDKTAK